MSSKNKRSAPYSVPSRVSTRSSDRNSSDNTSVSGSRNVQATDHQLPSTSSTSEGHSGPSWDDFKKLQESVTELSQLLKQNMLPREAPIVSNQNVMSSGVNNVENNVPMNPTVSSDSNEINRVINEAFQQSDASQAFNDNVPSTAPNSMQATMNEYIQSFTGSIATSGEINFYNPPGRPVDLKVNDKIRQKIWSHEYVDFNTLLDPDSDYDNSFTIVSNQGEPLKLSQTKSTKVIQSLGQWCTAFEIFLTIYCKKFPGELPKLMTYMKSVKQMAHRDGDYITYDKEFRYLKQSTNMSWDTVHAGLWLECRDSKLRKQKQKQSQNSNNSFRGNARDNSRQNGSSSHPIGYCFRYHSFGKCGRSSCTYKHACYKCNDSPHSILRCPKCNGETQTNKNEQTKSSANSNKTQ